MKSLGIPVKSAARRVALAIPLGVGSVALALLAVAQPTMAREAGFIPAAADAPPPSGARGLCGQYSWACASKVSPGLSAKQEIEIIRAINHKVNTTTREVTDQSQYRMAELWALPTARGGDCEDFALLKKRDLIKAGINPRKLLIATVLDRRQNPHAVLVYRSESGDLILDNLTNQIKPWFKTRYLFLRMQDPKHPHKWVGVYSKS